MNISKQRRNKDRNGFLKLPYLKYACLYLWYALIGEKVKNCKNAGPDQASLSTVHLNTSRKTNVSNNHISTNHPTKISDLWLFYFAIRILNSYYILSIDKWRDVQESHFQVAKMQKMNISKHILIKYFPYASSYGISTSIREKEILTVKKEHNMGNLNQIKFWKVHLNIMANVYNKHVYTYPPKEIWSLYILQIGTRLLNTKLPKCFSIWLLKANEERCQNRIFSSLKSTKWTTAKT